MTKQNEIVESLKAAASRLGIELHRVKTAKKQGCRAFKPGGRVHLGELRQWFVEKEKVQKPLPALTPDELNEMGTIESTLQAAIRDEVEVGRQLQRARDCGDAGAVSDLTLAIGRARKNRLALETAITKLQATRGELLSMDAWKIELNRLYVPITTAVRQIPRKAAMQIGGGDEAQVEKIVSEVVEEALAQVKTIVMPSSTDERNWAASQLLVVISGPDRKINSQSLELVDSLRSFVVEELAKAKGEAPAKAEKPAAEKQACEF